MGVMLRDRNGNIVADKLCDAPSTRLRTCGHDNGRQSAAAMGTRRRLNGIVKGGAGTRCARARCDDNDRDTGKNFRLIARVRVISRKKPLVWLVEVVGEDVSASTVDTVGGNGRDLTFVRKRRRQRRCARACDNERPRASARYRA